MKFYLLLSFLTLSSCIRAPTPVAPVVPIAVNSNIGSREEKIDVCFPPQEQCLPKLLPLLNRAQYSIYVQAYSFTSFPIAHCLVHAKSNGVKVVVILDKSQTKSDIAMYLIRNNVEVFIDDKPAIAHNKVILIDNDTVITGSYNFTNSAEKRNAENLIIIKDEALALKYFTNFNHRLAQSYTLSLPAAEEQPAQKKAA